MTRKRGLELAILLFVVLISLNFVSAKTLQANLLVQGTNPVREVEFYYDYPVYYTIFTNYSVALSDLKVVNEDMKSSSQGSFEARLISNKRVILNSTYFEPNFLILSDPPTETDLDLVSLNLHYLPNAKYLKVYWNNKEKLSVDISKLLCNNNKKCENEAAGNFSMYENYLSCSDCRFYDQDSLCTGAGEYFNLTDENNLTLDYWEDNYCDLDCYKDDDCSKENCNDNIKNHNETGIDCGGVCFEECATNLWKIFTGQAIKDFVREKSFPVVLVLIILGLIIFIALVRRKK